jgi:hypothetical protein
MLSTTLNPSAIWLILSACTAASHRAYKFNASLMTHLEFYHNSTPSVNVSNWCGFCYTPYKNLFWVSLNSRAYFLTHHETFYILYTFSITFQLPMPVILRSAKISRLQVLSHSESYLSILKLLTAEALETYSIWSISHLFMGLCLFPISSLLTLKTG